MKDIVVQSGQPVLAPSPKMGTPITQDQFSMDFEVVVDSDGCYVVDFRLLATMTGAGPAVESLTQDRVLLEDSSAEVTPFCLAKGSTSFHVTVSTPPPAGATALPTPANVKVITLAGSWPSSTSATFTFEIVVYRIGTCVDGKCAAIKRSTLAKATRYATFTGPRAGADSVDDDLES